MARDLLDERRTVTMTIELGPNLTILITGSIFFVGLILAIWASKP